MAIPAIVPVAAVPGLAPAPEETVEVAAGVGLEVAEVAEVARGSGEKSNEAAPGNTVSAPLTTGSKRRQLPLSVTMSVQALIAFNAG